MAPRLLGPQSPAGCRLRRGGRRGSRDHRCRRTPRRSRPSRCRDVRGRSRRSSSRRRGRYSRERSGSRPWWTRIQSWCSATWADPSDGPVRRRPRSRPRSGRRNGFRRRSGPERPCRSRGWRGPAPSSRSRCGSRTSRCRRRPRPSGLRPAPCRSARAHAPDKRRRLRRRGEHRRVRTSLSSPASGHSMPRSRESSAP